MIDITHLSSVLFASRPAASVVNTNLIGPGMARFAVSYGGTGGGPNGKKEDKRHSLTVQGKENESAATTASCRKFDRS